MIHGRVQGVFFRDTMRRMAETRGVAGWVRNTPEGTVEAVFEGEPDAVEELIRSRTRARAGRPWSVSRSPRRSPRA